MSTAQKAVTPIETHAAKSDRLRLPAKPDDVPWRFGRGDPLDEMFDEWGNCRPEWRATGVRPLDSLERVEFWRILESCLRGLPTRQADAFVLRELEEQTTEKICKALQVSSSNVWVLLHRARTRLSRCMNVRWLRQER